MIDENILQNNQNQGTVKNRRKRVVIELYQIQRNFIQKIWNLRNSQEVVDQFYLKKCIDLLEYQKKKLAEKEEYKNYILGIQGDYELNKKQKNNQYFTVTYNCSENAQSLEIINYVSKDQKFEVFNKLIKLSEFLKNEKIIHNNIKPSNIIFDNNQLYLTDFGYDSNSEEYPFIFKDCLNFMGPLNKKQKDIYLHTQQDLLLEIQKVKAQLSQDEDQDKRDMIIKKNEKDVQNQDQYALTVMMFGIFYKFENINNLEEFIANSSKSNRIQQLSWLKQKSEDLADSEIAIIQEILKERFGIEQNLSSDFPRTLSIFNYKINKTKLMKEDLSQHAQNILNIDNEFDLNLLYHLTFNDLEKKYGQKSQKPIKLKEMLDKLLQIYMYLNKCKFDDYANQIQKYQKEDVFIFLVYLDQKIEQFQIKHNQDQEIKNLLEYYKLKSKCEKNYHQINNISAEEFMFNNIQFKQPSNQIPKNEINLSEQRYNQSQTSQLEEIQENSQQIGIKQFFKTLEEKIADLQKKLKETHNAEIAKQLTINEILIGYLKNQYFGEGYHLEKNNDFGDIIQIRIKNKNHPKNTIQIIFLKKDNFIIDERQLDSKKTCKQIQVRIYYRHFKPSEYFIFRLIQEYEIFDQKACLLDQKDRLIDQKDSLLDQKNSLLVQKVCLLDYKQNVKYEGQYDENVYKQSKQIQFEGEGTLEILDQSQLLIGQVFQITGTFKQNKADGNNIKTYFYDKNPDIQTYCEGEYKNGLMKGRQIHKMTQSNIQIKSTYHINFYKWSIQFG